jgi:hypothetical protein
LGDVIGGAFKPTPQGASGQSIEVRRAQDDTPIPSGEVLRSAKYPEAQGGGKPSDGLLPIVFHSGDKSGHIG